MATKWSSGLTFALPRRVAPAIALLAIAAAGCGESITRVAVVPVKGQVLVDGQNAEGAFVVFHPVGAEQKDLPTPRGHVEKDGSFQLTTYDSKDGAPQGEYAVTVEWRKLVDNEGGKKAGPNILPERFAKKDASPLRVKVASASTNLPPFKLDRK